MSGPENKKFNKSCLILLDSKRSLSLKKAEEFCTGLASYGYYFDSISRVAYDDSGAIVRVIKQVKSGYENLFVLCPKSMNGMIKDFLCQLYGGDFDALGVLTVQPYTVAVLNTDGKNRLTFEDIRKIYVGRYGVQYDKAYVKFVGAPDALVSRTLSRARSIFETSEAKGEIYFNLDENFDDYRLEIVYSSQAPKMLVDEVQRCVIGGLNDYVYALEDVPLAEQLFRLLQLRRLKISIAESFTGGGVGKKLVEVPGVSEVYTEGLNTYSNFSKQQRLNVSELTIKQCGAVSPETAYQMVEGLLKNGTCDVAVSTTGIAGPKSDNTSKPIGLAYIGVGLGEDISVYRFNFTGDRERITNCAVNHALFLAYKKLK